MSSLQTSEMQGWENHNTTLTWENKGTQGNKDYTHEFLLNLIR